MISADLAFRNQPRRRAAAEFAERKQVVKPSTVCGAAIDPQHARDRREQEASARPDLRAEGALGKRLSQGLACAILNLRFHVGGGDRSVGLARHVIARSCREADMPISLIGWGLDGSRVGDTAHSATKSILTSLNSILVRGRIFLHRAFNMRLRCC